MKRIHQRAKSTCVRVAALFLYVSMVGLSAAFPGETIAVTVGLPGYGPYGPSSLPSISADGRYIAFESDAPDLVFGDTNGTYDIFVSDRVAGTTIRASVSTSGTEADGQSRNCKLSGDGRYVTFESDASNLVSGDTNGTTDIFRRDLLTGTTVRVNVSHAGKQVGSCYSPDISRTGRFIIFQSQASDIVLGDKNGFTDIFLRDMDTGTVALVSVSSLGAQSNGSSSNATLSEDGRYIAFTSAATNFSTVMYNGPNLYYRDMALGTTSLISVSSAGVPANLESRSARISSTGRFVVFESRANNLVDQDTNNLTDVFLRDMSTQVTLRVSTGSDEAQSNGASSLGSISRDGRFVSFSSSATNLVQDDKNGYRDAFVKDLQSGKVAIQSQSPSGQANNAPSNGVVISDDAGVVAFSTSGWRLVVGDLNAFEDLYTRDRSTGMINRTSLGVIPGQGDGVISDSPAISSDGRYVAFMSYSTNLVEGDHNLNSDIFVRDTVLAKTTRVTMGVNGTETNRLSWGPSISDESHYIAFSSDTANLVIGDTNGQSDVFVRNMQSGEIVRASVGTDGREGNWFSDQAAITRDGSIVVFRSNASNLVEGDLNGFDDIFIRHLNTGISDLVSLSTSGRQGDGNSYSPSVSQDHRYVAFTSSASNFAINDTNGVSDVFVRDLLQSTTTLLSRGGGGLVGNGSSALPAISSDGQYVAFASSASNLVNSDNNSVNDIFVWERATGALSRVSVNTQGAECNGDCTIPKISADGRYVCFVSTATNLVSDDLNGEADVFVRDTKLKRTYLVSRSSTGTVGNSRSDAAGISADGRFVAFQSVATNLTALVKSKAAIEIFRHDLKEIVGPVTVKLQFEGWEGLNLPIEASYILRKAGGSVVSSGSLRVRADGVVEIPAPNQGNYAVTVRSSVFLGRKIEFAQGSTTVELGPVLLRNGDCDGDNIVSIRDYNLLSSAFDSSVGTVDWDPRADLDGDGVVTVFDYSVWSSNWGLSGEN